MEVLRIVGGVILVVLGAWGVITSVFILARGNRWRQDLALSMGLPPDHWQVTIGVIFRAWLWWLPGYYWTRRQARRVLRRDPGLKSRIKRPSR